MNVLVVNLGAASFKYKLVDTESGREIVGGSFTRIGQPESPYVTHTDVLDEVLSHLDRPPDAIGFRAVQGGPISGAVRVTDDVVATMRRFADAAPAHNPQYIAIIEAFRQRLPGVPQVAAFETSFHQTIPLTRQVYAVPQEWAEKFGIRRYGYHGASHSYIAQRMASLAPDAKRIISCHLGGSCSVCAIHNGKSVANSFGMTLQSGLPHASRVGDFDCFALQALLKQGYALEDILQKLSSESGLLGLSGISADMRDILRAAGSGDPRARFAIDAFTEAIRHYVGAYLAVLGGADVLVFTGGIGENAAVIREAVCRDMIWAGIDLDLHKNQVAGREAKISAVESAVEVWVIPSNEELMVARQTAALIHEPAN